MDPNTVMSVHAAHFLVGRFLKLNKNRKKEECSKHQCKIVILVGKYQARYPCSKNKSEKITSKFTIPDNDGLALL